MSQKQTPEELQGDAVTYFAGLKTPAHVTIEVWSSDEDSGEKCYVGDCHRVGFVFIGKQCYCVRHASIIVMGLRTTDAGTRHVSIDVARPICVPDELAACEDLLEVARNFFYFVADHKGSTVTSFMYERATALGNRCDNALKARVQ